MTTSTPIQFADNDLDWELIRNTIIQGMPEHAYHELPLASASQLKTLHRATPMHLMHWLDSPKDTAAFRIGRALHCAVLQPSEFRGNFAVAPEVDKRSNANKEIHDVFEAELRPRTTVLSPKQARLVGELGNAVLNHHLATQMLDTCTEREVTIFAEINGVKCKSRIDAMSPDGHVFMDLKTTGSLASTTEMEREIWKFGYGLQMCMYREMVRAVGRDPKCISIVAVEKSAPHGVACFVIEEEVLDMHVPLMNRLLSKWQQTIDKGDAPGWEQDEFIQLGVPAWAQNELEQECFNITNTQEVLQ